MSVLRLSARMDPNGVPVMQPKGAEPLASAPLGNTRSLCPKSPDRNAVPSRDCAFEWPLG